MCVYTYLNIYLWICVVCVNRYNVIEKFNVLPWRYFTSHCPLSVESKLLLSFCLQSRTGCTCVLAHVNLCSSRRSEPLP